jgi:hypothetical protein
MQASGKKWYGKASVPIRQGCGDSDDEAGASRLSAASIPASTLGRCSRLKAVSESRSFQLDPRKPAQLYLAQPADFLDPADSGFHELADLEAPRVALVARGAGIDD